MPEDFEKENKNWFWLTNRTLSLPGRFDTHTPQQQHGRCQKLSLFFKTGLEDNRRGRGALWLQARRTRVRLTLWITHITVATLLETYHIIHCNNLTVYMIGIRCSFSTLCSMISTFIVGCLWPTHRQLLFGNYFSTIQDYFSHWAPVSLVLTNSW